MKRFGTRKILGLFALLAILIALPFSVFLIRQQQETRQRAASLPQVPSIVERGARFLQNFVNQPEEYGVDTARAAGNRAIALAYLQNKAEAKQVLLLHLSQLGTDANAAIGAYSMGLAAYLSKDVLTASESNSVKSKIIQIVNAIPATPGSRIVCDTSAEHNAWHAAILALAANFYSSDPMASTWEAKARLFAFHALTKAPGESYGGMTSANVDASYLLDNHNAHPNVHYAYAGSIGELGMGALTYILTRKPVPQEFKHNVTEVFNAHRPYFSTGDYRYQNWIGCEGNPGPVLSSTGRDDWGGDATWNNSAFAYYGYLAGNYDELDALTTFEYKNGSVFRIEIPTCCGRVIDSKLRYLLYSVIAKRSAIAALIYAPEPSSTPPTSRRPYPEGSGPKPIPGTIQAEDYDIGGEGVSYHDVDSGNNGGAYRSDGVDVKVSSDAL